MVESPSGDTKANQQFLYRAVRYFIWLGLRNVWLLFQRVGISLPLEVFVRHPLDAKIARQFASPMSGDRLLAICDFAGFPLSYDIAVFLAASEQKRIELGLRWLDLAFVSHHEDPVQDGISLNNPVQQGYAKTVLFNVAVDMSRLLQSQGNVYVFLDRLEFERFWRSTARKMTVFPAGYSPFRPEYAPEKGMPPLYGLRHLDLGDGKRDTLPFRAPSHYRQLARYLASKLSPGQPFVTITLRESPHQPERNSSLQDWQRLIDHFSSANVTFIILRDFYTVENNPVLTGDNVFEAPEAVTSLLFRVALYQESALNLFVNGGPAFLCVLVQDAKHLIFRVGLADNNKDVDYQFYQHGLSNGESPFPDDPARRFIWKADTFDVLRDEIGDTLKSLGLLSQT